MDIICAKCGKHFSSVEAAREHRGNCRATSEGEPIHWVPARKSKITPAEWENLMRLINSPLSSQSTPAVNVEPSTERKRTPPSGNKTDKRGHFRVLGWLTALLLVFSLSIAGLGISMFVGSFIPLWLLLGFSIIFSVEKWFSYQTRKHKPIGMLYRLFLNLAVLSVLGFLVWSGIKLFSHQFLFSSLIGSLVFLAELVFFIWMCRVLSKNGWRRPSMKLTIFSLMVVAVVLAFAGVQPMASYKDAAITKWETYWAEQKIKREESQAQAKIEEQKRLEEQKATEQERIAEQEARNTQLREEQKLAFETKISKMEHEVVMLVNLIRADRGTAMLMWDEKLYQYSKTHSEAMAKAGDMFHTDMYQSYAENCWMGSGSRWEAADIVESWMSSPKHRTWLLCPNLKHVAVGIAYSNGAMYASWTFWRNETSQSDWWYQYTPDNPPKWWY